MISKTRLYILIAALGMEVVFALVARLDELARFARGDHTFSTTVAVIGLGWLVVVMLCAIAVGRSMFAARRALYQRDQAIAAAAATSPDWLWEADTQHRLTYTSSGVQTLLGYDPAQIIGRTMTSFMPAEEAAKAEQLMRRSLATRSGWDAMELTWTHADGSAVQLQGTSAPILDERGTIVGFRGTRRLVTDAMYAERTLTAARQRVTRVLDAGDVLVALQPIVDVATGQLAGVEALARFPDGRGPEVWFRDARDTGLGLDLDRLAFTTALALLPELQHSCYLSINASPELLADEAFLRMLLTGDIPLERLVIEITEHVQIGNYTDLHAFLAPLRERGVRLAIDDTGAGYASLSHVLQLRPDIIKIDRSLVTNIAGDPARRSLVTALVLLALDLNATLTGEGVETAAELATLEMLGVDQAQGYFLARPTSDRARWSRWQERSWLPPVSTAVPAQSGALA